MIPGLAKYFDHAESFLKMEIIRLSRGGNPVFGAESHSPANPVTGVAPSLNLRTTWGKKWLIYWVFLETSENIVDKYGPLTPISSKIQSQREYNHNNKILFAFLLTQK